MRCYFHPFYVWGNQTWENSPFTQLVHCSTWFGAPHSAPCLALPIPLQMKAESHIHCGSWEQLINRIYTVAIFDEYFLKIFSAFMRLLLALNMGMATPVLLLALSDMSPEGALGHPWYNEIVSKQHYSNCILSLANCCLPTHFEFIWSVPSKYSSQNPTNVGWGKSPFSSSLVIQMEQRKLLPASEYQQCIISSC